MNYLHVHKTLQVKCSLNCHVVISGCELHASNVFCLGKYVQDSDVSTLEELSKPNMLKTLNEIYVLSVPLMNLILMGWRTILKERAFEQCIATWGLDFMRQSL